jgi:hypothetical protein
MAVEMNVDSSPGGLAADLGGSPLPGVPAEGLTCPSGIDVRATELFGFDAG